MRPFFICLTFLTTLSLSGFTIESRAQQWERYKGRGEEFSVEFPERPATAQTFRPARFIDFTKEEHYRGTLYSAYADGVAYLVFSFTRRSEPLSQYITEFTNRYSYMKVLSGRDVTTGNVAGRRYLIKFKELDGVLDFYVTDKHAYVLQVVGGDETNPPVSRFLQSFTLHGDDKSAIEVSLNEKRNPQPANALETGVVFSSKEVTRRPVFVYRAEPAYTAEAREARVNGKIVIKAVLSSTGRVTNIEVVKSLPRGLDEKAIEAARQMVFIPAMKDGKFVSQSVQVEYNFSIF